MRRLGWLAIVLAWLLLSSCAPSSLISGGAASGRGIITTIAGTGIGGYSGDGGSAAFALLYWPSGAAVNSSGTLFIADQVNNVIRTVDAAGTISTYAGTYGQHGYAGDGGPATAAWLRSPTGVAIDSSGNLYIADTGNNVIRMVSAAGTISTVAGNNAAGPGYSGDGGAATAAQLNNPTGVAVDAGGRIYIADTLNEVIREVNAGTISTVAGDNAAGPGYSGDGGPATSAKLNNPTGVAVDSAGAISIADQLNHVVRGVSVSGTITTIAGNGTAGDSGDGGAATSAQLNGPSAITLDSAGNLFISDTRNNRVRKVEAGVISAVAGSGTPGDSGDDGIATFADLLQPWGLCVDAAGSIMIADLANNKIRRVQ